MSRLVDPVTGAIRVHGDVRALPRPLGAALLHLHRMMLLLDHVWNQPSAVDEWSARARALADWMDNLR